MRITKQLHTNIRIIILVVIFFLSLTNANSQTLNIQEESPDVYFNNFQKFIGEKPDVDSAFFCIQKIASSNKYVLLLRMLLHDIFAQEFGYNSQSNLDTLKINTTNKFSAKLLFRIMLDTTKLLLETAKPIYLLSRIQDAKNNETELTALTEEFIEHELLPKFMYDNKTLRYGLMIYQVISKNPALEPLSQKLFTIIFTHLKNNQIVATDSSKRIQLDKRSWYRYLYAYVNYIEANKSDDRFKKGVFFKKAFNFSPDIIDKNHAAAYFYDMLLLFGEEKQSFKEDYIKFLSSSSNNKELILSTLLQMALVEPEYKNQLKDYYQTGKKRAINFNDYWIKAINSTAKISPAILLGQLNKKLFSSKKLLGKWIIIDFWGTWCGPCREEHPDMQQFYDSTVLVNDTKITLLTIACKDTEKKVLSYMKENNFSFPVAMSDSKIENTFSVQGYPTKILITPKGKYISIPFGIDWRNFIKQYCAL